MPADYLPRSDSQLCHWAQNWLTAARACPASAKLEPAQIEQAAAAIAAFMRAMEEHHLAQRNARSARAAKDQARRECEGAIRIVTNILQAGGISDAERAAMGVRIPRVAKRGALAAQEFNPPPPRVRIDTSRHMEHLIRFTSSERGFRRAKPRGALHCEIWIAVCDTPDQPRPQEFTFLTTAQKTPHRHQFVPEMAHKILWYRLRWADGYGRFSGWSEDLRTTVMV